MVPRSGMRNVAVVRIAALRKNVLETFFIVAGPVRPDISTPWSYISKQTSELIGKKWSAEFLESWMHKGLIRKSQKNEQ
jgi:hypothetical protein